MRCSYCRRSGHNKTTCEEQTEYLKNKAEYSGDRTDSSYWKRRYEERIAPKGQKMSSKVCGYCRDLGHTRRTCVHLLEDRNWYVQQHNELVGFIHDFVVSSPIGIGSLFKIENERWETHEYKTFSTPFLLVGFEMPANLLTTRLRPLMILKGLSNKLCVVKKPLRPFIRGLPDRDYNDKATLVSPCNGIVSTDWVSSRVISFEDTKSIALFKRTGKTRHDYRHNVLDSLSDAKRIVKETDAGIVHHYSYKSAAARIEEWKPRNICAKMMLDYKNE